ncbi:MAG TPA: Ig-like domain repeat protein [Saprospiraceae bacterium]|nr:Ig-like domain repeat protein [Saprospiraceae bacterium]
MKYFDRISLFTMLRKLLICTVLLTFVCSAAAEEATGDEIIPDFYKDPGLYPNRDYINQHVNEHIDPFTGALQYHYVDLHIPGNGSFDLKVIRSYNSSSIDNHDNRYKFESLAGLGWTVHFGKVTKARNSILCYDINTASVKDNPVLELPDGSRQVLAFTGKTTPTMLTKQYWRGECISGGIAIYSPDGARYDMTHLVREDADSRAIYSWYTTKITDRNGNSAEIKYAGASNPEITQVSTNDGRSISFTYADSGTFNRRITKITGAGQTYRYNYTPVTISGIFYQLTSVVRPDGTQWQYAYNDNLGFSPGSYLMKSATYPHGGSIEYSYDFHYLGHINTVSKIQTTVVTKKSVSSGGTWNFKYVQGSPGIPDTTTVKTPSVTITYRHIGTNYFYSHISDIWMTGLLVSKTIGNVQTETYTWDKLKISNENDFRPGAGGFFIDSLGTYAPILTQQIITRDGASYTTKYSNFDDYGNPTTISEAGSNGGNRTTSLTYFYNRDKWIVKQVKNESFDGSSTIRSFDSNGNLLSLNQDSVVTTHTYDKQGNRTSTTFPRSLIHYYSHHKRGIPQTESQPEGITLYRVVNDAGNVISETNGEGHTTTYDYDGLNRVRHIGYSAGNDVDIQWGNDFSFGFGNFSRKKTATRGNLEEITLHDSFGRPVSHTIGGIKHTYRYDALGRKTFQSNPNSEIGTTYQYDILDRVTRITHPDNTVITILYSYGNKIVTDERGKKTTYCNRAYGNPDQTLLMGISTPDASANIGLTRNSKGLVTSITQGATVSCGVLFASSSNEAVSANNFGVFTPFPSPGTPTRIGEMPLSPIPSNTQDSLTRTYTYNSNYYLISVTNPETGLTTYGRDVAGNMTSRKVGSSGTTTYSYDGQNRLVAVTYPGNTPSITNTYNKIHKLVHSSSSVASRNFSYDANSNLTSESVTVDGRTFTTSYAYNGNDQITAITYPHSGRVVSYAPDVLGRPTLVSDFITGVTYWPSGQIRQINYANGMVTNYNQNSRLWPITVSAQNSGGTYYLNSNYSYDGAGNLTSISDSIDNKYNRTMGYDDINRLTSITGPWGTGSVAYNGAGNITSQSFGGFNLSYSYDAQNRLSAVSGSRTAAYSYDTYGNIIADASKTFFYDDAINLRCVNCNDPTKKIEYAYDNANQRISVTKGSTKTYEIYGSHGNLLIEYIPGTIDGLTEYIYLGGRRIAQVQTGNTSSGTGGTISTIELLVTSDTVGQDQVFVLTANVSGDNPTGTVTFMDGATVLGSATLESGQASISVSLSTVGMHNITANYEGDGKHRASSSMMTLTVEESVIEKIMPILMQYLLED